MNSTNARPCWAEPGDVVMSYTADTFFAELAARRTLCEHCGKPLPSESARHGHKMHRRCRADVDARARYAAGAVADPLNAAFASWAGGDRFDMRPNLGLICDVPCYRLTAAGWEAERQRRKLLEAA